MINFLNGKIPDYSFFSDYIEKFYSYPTDLIEKLRRKELDLSPVSSAEYIFMQDDYFISPKICIASDGEVDSVGVFSKYSPNQWDNKKIFITGSSMTSKYLLKVLCKNYFKVKPNFIYQNQSETFSENISEILKKYDGALLIGDLAHKTKKNEKISFWDLGLLWKEWTNLPFVFALWLVHRNYCNKNKFLVKKVENLFLDSIENGLKNIQKIYEREDLSLDFIHFHKFLSSTMQYYLDQSKLEGLMRFSKELKKAGFISSELDIKPYI